MKMGHTFHPQAGFTGSANPGMDMRPKIPGYKRGGMDHEMEHKEHGDHPKHDGNMHEDEHGFHIHKGHKHGGKVHMKDGGKVHGHKKHHEED